MEYTTTVFLLVIAQQQQCQLPGPTHRIGFHCVWKTSSLIRRAHVPSKSLDRSEWGLTRRIHHGARQDPSLSTVVVLGGEYNDDGSAVVPSTEGCWPMIYCILEVDGVPGISFHVRLSQPLRAASSYGFLFFFSSSLSLSSRACTRFYPKPSSGQAVVTGAYPSSPPARAFVFCRIGFSFPTARRLPSNVANSRSRVFR